MNKQAIIAAINDILLSKKSDLQRELNDLQQGMADDTKSSAGDKYETARAMSQQEMEKIGAQLAETNRQLALLSGLKDSPASTTVQNGSLVTIATGTLFIGIPLGQIQIGGTTVFCISAAAPLAQAMLGKTEKQDYLFNGKSGSILTLQ